MPSLGGVSPAARQDLVLCRNPTERIRADSGIAARPYVATIAATVTLRPLDLNLRLRSESADHSSSRVTHMLPAAARLYSLQHVVHVATATLGIRRSGGKRRKRRRWGGGFLLFLNRRSDVRIVSGVLTISEVFRPKSSNVDPYEADKTGRDRTRKHGRVGNYWVTDARARTPMTRYVRGVDPSSSATANT